MNIIGGMDYIPKWLFKRADALGVSLSKLIYEERRLRNKWVAGLDSVCSTINNEYTITTTFRYETTVDMMEWTAA